MRDLGHVLLLLILATFCSAQQPSVESAESPPQIQPSSQPAVDTLRVIARLIRECSAALDRETKWGKGRLEVERWFFGPPKNVVWDIIPGKTVRAPYAGFIEFSVSHYFQVPPESQEKYDRQLHLVPVDLGDYNFRYEFDVGPQGAELTRVLRRFETASRWMDFDKRDVCWDNAAREARPSR
jgi:hypothetical protein